MSASEKIPNVVSSDDEEDDQYDVAAFGKKQRRQTVCGFGKEAKQVVLHQFAKAKTKIRGIRSKRVLLPSSSSSSSENASAAGSGKKSNKMIIRGDDIGSGSRTGCKFCFLRPKVLESPDGSPTSDPNDPNFTHAMLRTLIEKNDFYSKDCNPHLDY